MRRPFLFAVLAAACLLTFHPAALASVLYGNNFGNTAHIDIINPITGVVTSQFDPRAGNGRGVVVVGNTMYYTLAASGSVYSYNLGTNTDNGALFSVAGASGLSTAAFDGTNLILGDYSGTNKAYVYTLGGTLVRTITLINCSGSCDGLEYFVDPNTHLSRLISNRGDGLGPYDVYDYSTGTLLTPNFISSHNNVQVTGIAFDGTNFFVSDIFNSQLEVFNSSGTWVRNMTVTGNTGSEIEDLSADYSTVLSAPEPATIVLVGLSLAGLGVLRRRRKSA